MDASFWEDVYQSGRTRFDLGGPTIPLTDFLDRTTLTPGRAIVPGCGRGYDVLELARRGWDALGIDFAPSAIHDAEAAARKSSLDAHARFAQIDLFELKAEPFDLWWENTCYCAIEPKRRDDYARAASSLVRPGGLLVFCVFPIDGREGGPPFAVDPKEIAPRFERWFSLEEVAPPPRHSTAAREGKELLAILRRNDVK